VSGVTVGSDHVHALEAQLGMAINQGVTYYVTVEGETKNQRAKRTPQTRRKTPPAIGTCTGRRALIHIKSH
jgi:hypothetical protein